MGRNTSSIKIIIVVLITNMFFNHSLFINIVTDWSLLCTCILQELIIKIHFLLNLSLTNHFIFQWQGEKKEESKAPEKTEEPSGKTEGGEETGGGDD